ncbi:MAG: hypothetical protein ACU0CB_03740 [Roseovarius sp.]|jgi:hypothetical protein|uniref:hypothetical protein n=1 Tax=Roseovarius sp. TaxID=1486281 RepID=UPI00260C55B9|nr:hypothetical protein [Roseovarius sp.]
MSKKQTPDKAAKQGPSREDRLKSALKANLARRKAQMRAKADGLSAPKPAGTNDKG